MSKHRHQFLDDVKDKISQAPKWTEKSHGFSNGVDATPRTLKNRWSKDLSRTAASTNQELVG
jgi:hypothetical protein